MKKSKILIIISLIFIFSQSLHAEDKSTILPLPVITIFGSNTDYISLDLGVELYTENDTLFTSFGLYTLGGIGTDFNDVYFRFSGGLAIDTFFVFGARIGVGVEKTPGRDSFMFTEICLRALFLEIKGMIETPVNGKTVTDMDYRIYVGVPVGVFLPLFGDIF